MTIHRLCGLLEDAGVELSTEELLDILWLAVTTRPGTAEPGDQPSAAAQPAAPEPTPTAPPDGHDGTGEDPDAEGDRDGDRPEDRDRRAAEAIAAGLYAPGGGRPGGRLPARPVDVRGVRALPAARGLHRALRPLRRPVPSRTAVVLDEKATADLMAEAAVPDVVLRPASERWLEAVLVIDDGPSMVLWRQYAAEARALLERQGLFHRVRTYGLDSGDPLRPVLRSRPFQPSSSRTLARRLADPVRPTVVLVLSDGVGPGWASGAIPRLLDRWAGHSPVAVVQPLPERLWPVPGMPVEHLLVTADRPAAPGRSLRVRHPVLPKELVRYEGTAIPVLELEEARLSAWAGLLLGRATTGPLPVLMLPDPPAGADAPEGPRGSRDPREQDPGDQDPRDRDQGPAGPATLSPEERLRRFRGSASPESRRLAGALASVRPLTLPVMRLVHRAQPPGPGRFHPAQLAEVFLGGLLRRAGEPDLRTEGRPADRRHPDNVEYEFLPGVADLLLDTVRTSHAVETAERVGAFLMSRRGVGPEFRARLSGGTGASVVDAEAGPFAAASPQLLRRLGLSAQPPRPQPVGQTGTAVPAEKEDVQLGHVWPRLAALVRLLRDDPTSPGLVGRAARRFNEWLGVDEPGSDPVYVVDQLASTLVSARYETAAEELRTLLRDGIAPYVADSRLAARNVRGHLAIALSTLGETDEARAHLQDIIAISEREHGPEHHYTLNARRYLHEMLWDADRLEEGEAAGRSLIEALARLPYAPEQPDRGRVFMTQGYILRDLGRLRPAQAAFLSASAAFADESGFDHDTTLHARGWVASTLFRLGRVGDAEEEVRDVLRRIDDLQEGGEESGAAAQSGAEDGTRYGTGRLLALSLLGDILKRTQRTEELVTVRQAELETSEGRSGAESRRSISARRYWADALREAGDFEAALREAEAAVALAERSLGERHVETLLCRELVALVLTGLSRYEEAELLLRRVLAQGRDVLGDDAPQTLSFHHNVGWVLWHADRQAEAAAVLEPALADHVRVLGEDHANTRVTRRVYARVLQELERTEEAEALLRALLDAEQRLLGPDEPSVARTRRDLGDLLRDTGRFEEAREQYVKVRRIREALYGPEASSTLAVAHSLGYVLIEAGRHAEAAGVLQEVARSRERVLGAEHVATLWSKERLARALEGLGRRSEATLLWSAARDTAVRLWGEDHAVAVAAREGLARLGE
ncbi:SAV_2336 N-terminal domain-related protein [Streptomyces sp. NPDC085481]|uniref:SAV_2336 N-terminal domain-related protein n=1 Tax=Streptomyces sp. NPDC085481 TaxID=3365727 RepID=UPI0037D1DB80